MSKSLGNYVGIARGARARCYGKLMSISDELMWRYFELLSTRPAADLASLRAGHPMEAKHALARELTERYHGAEAATEAQQAFRTQFSRRETPEDVPEIEVALERPQLFRALAASGLTKSSSEARRLIEQGGVDVDGTRERNPEAPLERGRTYLIRAGKRRLARLRLKP